MSAAANDVQEPHAISKSQFIKAMLLLYFGSNNEKVDFIFKV